MDSFGSEDDFGDTVPQSHSTPHAMSSQRHACPHCGKTFLSEWLFKKHVDCHKSATGSSTPEGTRFNTDPAEVDIELDLSRNVSFPLLQHHRRIESSRKPAGAPSRIIRKPKLVCTYCLKGYVCNRSFKNHLRYHIIQDAASRFPNKEALLGQAVDIAGQALTKTTNAPTAEVAHKPIGELLGEVIQISAKEEWSQFCSEVCEHLVAEVALKKFMLPSALLSGLMGSVHAVLSNTELCHAFFRILPLNHDYQTDLKSQFLLEFILHFAAEIVAFISKSLRADCRSVSTTRRVPCIDNEDKQVIFYIGGSIMRGYLRIAHRYNSNSTWDLIATVLKSKVLCDGPSDVSDAAWTKAVDRGGLLYPNEKFQAFLIAVTKIVFICENNDGSIDYNTVIQRVCESDTTVIWDEMISDSLPESISLNLMYDLIRCFSRTCGRGFAKRRINLFREKPVVSMPTRHLVASRKTH